MTIHVVRAGETVTSIAQSYGVAPQRLAADNAVPASGALAVGQTLVVRFPRQMHAVTAGETLAGIAEQYGTTVRQLWRSNWELGGSDALEAGQLLAVSNFEERLGSGVFNGYAYPFIQPELLAEQLPFLSTMAPFTYGINANGGLLPLADEEMVEAAQIRGTSPVMHLSTLTEAGQFDTSRAEAVLTDFEMQGRLMAEVLQTILRKGFVGLDVDFEYLPGQLAEAYAAFLDRLRQLLEPQGRFLWAALAPKTSTRQRGLLYEGHSYSAVAAAVDGVLLMTYEWGYTAGPPMAVAPLPNVREVLDYAVTEIPREKIYLGIPNYGYDWPLPFAEGRTRARSLSNQEAVELAVRYSAEIQFDAAAQAPWFNYTAPDGVPHVVWFEDARSMSAKLRLIGEYGLYGAGYWNLMRPYPQGWAVLNALYETANG